MKAQIPFQFEVREFVRERGYRRTGHYDRYAAYGSTEVEIREVSPDAAPVAALIPGHEKKIGYGTPVLAARPDGRPIELRWHGGRFWVDQGPAATISDPKADGREDDPARWPFRSVPRHADSKLTRAHVDRFDPDKLRDRVNAAASQARAAAANMIVVGDRVFESCTEPVFAKRTGNWRGEVFLFTPRGKEEAVGLDNQNGFSMSDNDTVRLTHADAPAEVLMPHLFVADLRPGALLRELRTIATDLARSAAQMPARHLAAARRFFLAVDDAPMHPTAAIAAAAAAFVELGPVPADERERLNAAFHSAHRTSKRPHTVSRPDTMASYVNASIERLARYLPEIEVELAARVTAESGSVDLGGIGLARRVDTAGEVFRAARIAGIDPSSLLDDVREGRCDVQIIERERVGRLDETRYPSAPESTIDGVRIVRVEDPGRVEFHWRECVPPERRMAAHCAEYPETRFEDRAPEMRP